MRFVNPLDSSDEFVLKIPADLTQTTRHWLLFHQGKLLVQRKNETLTPLQPNADFQAQTSLYVGSISGLAIHATHLGHLPPQSEALPLRAALAQLSPPWAGIVVRAQQLLTWEQSHRFCGVCSNPTESKVDEHAKHCRHCGHTAYPRLSPAMMALVVRGRSILLGRAKHFAPGVYSALAGFAEAGESIEQTVAREVLEETSIRVKNLQYFGSQSWPFPHSLMLAFVCEYAAGEIIIDPNELEDAQFFDIDALPTLPSQVSIARQLLEKTVVAIRRGWSASVKIDN